MKIKKVEIEGFRAYKFRQDGIFDFTLNDGTPSNFVALYAPNGFGKSSFYDAVEWAFTATLDRYTADHNKKNNLSAARGTKQDQVPLKIIRNKDVPSNIITRVEVITTRGVFPRSLPKLRSNSTDLDFKPSKAKSIKEGGGFERVILSQDAIDRFLKEAKPQERYDTFMQHFGGEAEALREEITVILTENKLTLDGLRKKKNDIKKLLKAPTDLTIFEKFNTLVQRLNTEGEQIPLVTDNFDSAAEYELVSHINERKFLVTSQQVTEEQREYSLTEQISRIDEFQINLDISIGQGSRLSLLTKGVTDSQQYLALFAAHDQNQSDRQQYVTQLTELETVERFIPDFLSDEFDRIKALQERDALINDSARESSAERSAVSNLRLLQESLASTDQRILALRTMLASSPSVYSELAMHRGASAQLKSQLQGLFDSVKLDQSELSRIKINVHKLETLLPTIESIKGPDGVLFELSINLMRDVFSAHQELENLEKHKLLINENQSALTRQKLIIEQLMSQGLAYIAEWPTDNCPLCRATHPSAHDLTSAIRGNGLLTDIEKQNAFELEKIAKRISDLRAFIESALGEARNNRNSKIIDLNAQHSQISLRLNAAQLQCKSLRETIKNTEHAIATLQANVWEVDSKELHSRVGVELSNLALASTSLQEKLRTANESLADQKNKLRATGDRIESLNVLVQNIVSKASYRMVLAFAFKEAVLDYQLLRSHCAQERANMEGRIEIISNQIAILLEQCQALQQIMLNDGNWIDFQLLATQKDETSRTVSDAVYFVESFMVGLNRLLGEIIEPIPTLMKQKIDAAIVDSSKQSAYLKNKVDSFELLIVQLSSFKSFLESLKLQEEVAKIDKEIIDHERVDNNLSHDRELVFAELRERIGSFFYSDLINSIYSKIDPHPSFKHVEFIPDFESAQPGLNIVLKDDSGDLISPMLYFSAAQLNILSLSVFLANALHAIDDNGDPLDVILIDDPIQSMDSINVLAVIDLLRNISVRFNKQIIISTHDENFFDLLKLKIPTEVFGSKFLQLESFGVVSKTQNAHDFVAGLQRPNITDDGARED